MMMMMMMMYSPTDSVLFGFSDDTVLIVSHIIPIIAHKYFRTIRFVSQVMHIAGKAAVLNPFVAFFSLGIPGRMRIRQRNQSRRYRVDR